jgi:hypothetical protein
VFVDRVCCLHNTQWIESFHFVLPTHDGAAIAAQQNDGAANRRANRACARLTQFSYA